MLYFVSRTIHLFASPCRMIWTLCITQDTHSDLQLVSHITGRNESSSIGHVLTQSINLVKQSLVHVSTSIWYTYQPRFGTRTYQPLFGTRISLDLKNIENKYNCDCNYQLHGYLKKKNHQYIYIYIYRK